MVCYNMSQLVVQCWFKFFINNLYVYRLGSLTFKSPDNVKYPSMNLAFAAGRAGGTMTGVLSAANEKAVELFINEKYVSFSSSHHSISSFLPFFIKQFKSISSHIKTLEIIQLS